MNRLTKDSAAVSKLVEKLETGVIKGTEDPKSVWLSDLFFQQHTVYNFSNSYHNIRTEFNLKQGLFSSIFKKIVFF